MAESWAMKWNLSPRYKPSAISYRLKALTGTSTGQGRSKRKGINWLRAPLTGRLGKPPVSGCLKGVIPSMAPRLAPLQAKIRTIATGNSSSTVCYSLPLLNLGGTAGLPLAPRARGFCFTQAGFIRVSSRTDERDPIPDSHQKGVIPLTDDSTTENTIGCDNIRLTS